MAALKERLVGKLGTLGFALWFIISLIFMVVPVAILPVSIWIRALILCVIYALPMIGLLVQIVVYFWGFFVAISGPQDIVAIIFYIVFALWICSSFIPLLISMFSGLFSKQE